MGTFRNQRTLARLLAAFCVAALVFGDLTRAVHLLTARHVVCLAHGELIEAPGAARSFTDSRESGGGVTHSDAAVERHEHCSVAAAPSRPLTASAIHANVLIVESPAPTVVPWPARPAFHTRTVLAFAPKQGPPV